MLFCTRDQITDLLLADYVKVCEGKNPGLVERTIEAVSGEIATVLSYRYPHRGRWCPSSSGTSPA